MGQEIALKKAIVEVTAELFGKRSFFVNLEPLILVTDQIPLTKIEYWESIIRSVSFEYQRDYIRAEFSLLETVKPDISWIDICSYDGYQREKALYALTGGAPNSFFFSMALRRLNDWVVEVRVAARHMILRLASETQPSYVVDALCYTLLHWTSWKRLGPEDKYVMYELIGIPRIAYELKKRIEATASGAMSRVLAEASRSLVFDKYLGDLAKYATQPAVRARASRCILAGSVAWVDGLKWHWTDKAYGKGRFHPVISTRPLKIVFPFSRFLEVAVYDRSPTVRRVGGEFLIKHLEEVGEKACLWAEKLAADKSRSVAERGEFALKKLGKR